MSVCVSVGVLMCVCLAICVEERMHTHNDWTSHHCLAHTLRSLVTSATNNEHFPNSVCSTTHFTTLP